VQKKTEEMLNKIKKLLLKNNYIDAASLAKECNLSVHSIYRAIRILRVNGTGIIPTKNGYILSEFAKKSDDVGFIRRCFGRRTSDVIALSAINKDIQKRWASIEDQKNMSAVFKYLSIKQTGTEKAKKSMKYMLSYVNGKGN
jgi:biotin operon repressor